MMVAVPGGEDPSATTQTSATLAVVLVGVLCVALAIHGTRSRRRYEEAMARAATLAAVQEDRLSIARDLHDIVSHGLGAITVRARAGRQLAGATTGAGGDVDAAVAALDDVVALSRSATEDLRRLLGVLRDQGAPAPLGPTPGLAQVGELVAEAQGRGATVSVTGADVRADTPGVELAAYHVVREALANVSRHAGPTRVAVTIRREPGRLTVSVTDDGPADGWVSQPGAGHGLDLLGTRVAAHGGTLRHGPRAVDSHRPAGYSVVASWPQDGAP